MLAFAAKFPIRNLAHSTAKRPSTFACRKVLESNDDLRELYRIHTKPDCERASQLATAALHNLEKFMSGRPIAAHTKSAFEKFRSWRSRPGARRMLAIDAGCGCGQSTARLARLLPDADVVGVDKSVARLSRNAAFRRDTFQHADNAMLLRAELVDFWRLCLVQGYRPDYHFLLYPNPYPKQADMKRRWHGHPVLPVIVALGGRLEIRASWDGYLREFHAAYSAIEQHAPYEPRVGDVEELHLREGHDTPLTNFEAKYMRVRHQIHRLVIDARPTLSEQPFETMSLGG